MKFEDLLLEAIRSSEIPLRFEPGAEESVAEPVTRLLESWIAAHLPANDSSEGSMVQRVLLARLLAELAGDAEVPQ